MILVEIDYLNCYDYTDSLLFLLSNELDYLPAKSSLFSRTLD